MRKAFLEFKLGRKFLFEDRLLIYRDDPRYDGMNMWHRAAEFRDAPFLANCYRNDLPKEADQLSQIVNEREMLFNSDIINCTYINAPPQAKL